MGRGKLTPESAARQKKLIAEARAKNNAVKAEAMKALKEKEMRAAIKAKLDSRKKPKTSRATPRTPKIRTPRTGGSGMRGGLGSFGSGGGLRGSVNK
jgi:anti-sigma factor RsiW